MPNATLNLAAVIAHRGASGYAPENTLAAMRKAQQLGAKWVEFDVTLAMAEEAIVLHDLSLYRTTGKRGRVAATPYSKIAPLDAGSWFAPEFSQEHIPTLIEVLTCLAELKLQFNLEIKPVPGQELITVQKVLTILEQYWHLPELPFLLSSSSLLCLQELQRLTTHIPIGIIAHHWPVNWQRVSQEFNCISWHLNHNVLNAKRVAQLRQGGKLVLAYTVNHAERAIELFNWGVNAVFTDYPDVIAKARQEMGWQV